MFRESVLRLGTHPAVAGAIKRYGRQLGADRFVAGETIDDVVAVSRDLNKRGIKVTVDHLGESVSNPRDADNARESYLSLLEQLHAHQIDGNVSLKLTMMGLLIDPRLAQEDVGAIVGRAAGLHTFVRIDMEDTPVTDLTIKTYEMLWERHPLAVGLVLQAYLYRTHDDLLRLSDVSRNFRIVKGAYHEPPSVAFPAKPDVDENYFQLVVQSLTAGHYTAIATHDSQLIDRILDWITQNRVARSQFEFQMLYGISMTLLEKLARQGYTTRVYVPYGQDWYAYFVRRIAERPANLLFFTKALLSR